MSARSLPALSVVVGTARSFAGVRSTLQHLRAQTIQRQLELVLVVSSPRVLRCAAPTELEGFHSVQVIPVGEITNVEKALALGIRASRAPVVALLEDHAFPEPGWAEATVAAHDGPWAGVEPVILNANPARGASWANSIIAYGPAMHTGGSGERDTISRHNSSYKRDALLAYGSRLPQMLGRDGDLLRDLREHGHRFYHEAGARIAHLNPSRELTTIQLRFRAGRLFAAKRVRRERWSPWRRTAFAAVSPVFPALRLHRLRGDIEASGVRDLREVRIYPALMRSLVADAAGQAVGYVFGPGRAVEQLATFEEDRREHLVEAERLAYGGQEQDLARTDVRLALIGCGRIARISHLRVLRRLEGARLVAVVDRDPAALAAAARLAPGARSLPEYRAVLDDPDVDAVVIALPPELHAVCAAAALQAGKHIYVEKPFATDLESARHVLALWAVRDLVGMVGHNFRCHPLFRQARSLLERGVIGEPTAIRSVFTSPLRTGREQSDVLLDLGTHHVDLCRFLLGEAVVDAHVKERKLPGGGSSAALELTLANGVRAESLFSRGGALDDRFEIHGTEGTILVNRLVGELRVRPAPGGRKRLDRLAGGITGSSAWLRRLAVRGSEPSYRIAFERFVASVRMGTPAFPDLEDGYRALEIVLRAREGSSRSAPARARR